jgi:hypothetical protein
MFAWSGSQSLLLLDLDLILWWWNVNVAVGKKILNFEFFGGFQLELTCVSVRWFVEVQLVLGRIVVEQLVLGRIQLSYLLMRIHFRSWNLPMRILLSFVRSFVLPKRHHLMSNLRLCNLGVLQLSVLLLSVLLLSVHLLSIHLLNDDELELVQGLVGYSYSLMVVLDEQTRQQS